MIYLRIVSENKLNFLRVKSMMLCKQNNIEWDLEKSWRILSNNRIEIAQKVFEKRQVDFFY